MSKGKICVSICAETADEFIEKINQAAEIADIIELRFDCLKESEFEMTLNVLSKVRIEKPYLATLRPKDKGGGLFLGKTTPKNFGIKRSFVFDNRIDAWNKILVLENVGYVDFDDDILTDFMRGKVFDENLLEDKMIIFSYHDFQGDPLVVSEYYRGLKWVDEYNFRCDIIKIAVQANEITDSLSVWELLETAKSENKQLIPIAMGEAGKWTRILGLAHGSPITYASLETGDETAPGQISAKDLIDVYRIKELNEQTEIYGIIGNPVSHSLSPFMHNAAFKHHNLNAVYIPFEVSDLDKFIKKMVRKETREIDWNLKGFSVTIPHKEAIMKHLDFIDEDAKAIGAVNTVKIIDKRLCGYNTDAHGFIEPLRKSYGDLKDANVGIIGSGGAARACIYALKKDGANVTIFARNIKKAKNLADEFDVALEEFQISNFKFQDQDILVNTTPLGTVGSLENKTPATAEQIKNIQLAYDLVYNPFETFFMLEAKSIGVPTIGGLAMLVAQGMKQFEIWTELEAPMQIMSRAALQILK